ncbi:hypothetical protein N866_19470 [Actinotalea ferrariae CF5-4]|uniref:Uncharacterized protein n=1 Tax=Actinotalea ferrariae CF5-4 TaxID=948458 RepID=A0A021VU58_9CELL|nr:hypothetical protein [Actinotalea ferrariae]EYR63580.1 hypothetical protein N866_19470 [Actinotalea ferrariae CF5-4]
MSASAFPAGPLRPAAPTRPAAARGRAGPGPVARRAGHVLGALVDVLLLVAVLVWPGWRAVPFLTEEFRGVLGLLLVSLLLNTVAELVYALVDRPRVKAVGDLVTLTVSLLVTLRLWQVFPFDLPDGTPWETVVRVLLVLGIVGVVVGMAVALVTAVRPARRPAG